MVDLLLALHLWRIVGKVLVNGEAEVEGAALVHALVRIDREDEVEEVIRVGEGGLHRLAQCAFQFC